MTTPILPTLPGLTWDITRGDEWSTTVQAARSGKETRIGNWTYPIYHWELVYDFLRADPSAPELQQLMAFFNAAGGQLGNWLYQDQDDNQATNQIIGIGDGVTTTFQLVRSFGGYIEPIWAPNVVSSVAVGGTAVTGWAACPFSGASPGLLTLAAAPASGAAVTSSFSFYFPCRFEADRLDLKMFLKALYRGEKVPFRSVK